VWHVSSGKLVVTLRGHTHKVYSAAFSPDGKWVVTASADGTAQVWHRSSGKPVAALRGHRGAVNAVAFSPDGKFVVTASADRTALIHEPEIHVLIKDLLVLARKRVTRQLTPTERQTYLHETSTQ
jgi:hypothetical protein